MTLKEFSELLGLSPTTVSRALGGYPDVSAKTRDRVVAAARLHGYAPNPQAQRLATGRAMAIGHVLPLETRETVNPIFGDFLAGAAETCGPLGYDMVLSFAPPGAGEATYRSLVEKRRVDGVLVHGPGREDIRPAILDALGLPYLIHGRVVGETQDHSWLDIDNEGAFAAATRHLLDLGHTRIALVNGPAEQGFAHRRTEGYRKTLAARGIEVDPALVHASRMTEAEGAQATERMLGLTAPPTAILASSIMTALGVERAVHARGLVLGADVDVIAHDDALSFLPNDGTPPRFTCTRSSVRAAGARAAALLIARFDTPGAPPVQELWDVPLVLGASTRAPTRA